MTSHLLITQDKLTTNSDSDHEKGEIMLQENFQSLNDFSIQGQEISVDTFCEILKSKEELSDIRQSIGNIIF